MSLRTNGQYHACSYLSVRFLAVDDYVIRSLESVKHQKTNSGPLAVFYSSSTSPASREKLIETFNYMADIMERELSELVLVLFVLPNRTY